MEKVAVTLKETEAVKVWFLIIIGACQLAWKGDEDYCDNDDDEDNDNDDNNKIRFDVVYNLYRSNSKACECSHLKANAMSTIKLFSPNLSYFLFFLQAALQTQRLVFLEYFHLSPLKVYVSLSIFLLDWGMSNNTEINAYWSALGNCRQGPVIASIDGLFAIPFSFLVFFLSLYLFFFPFTCSVIPQI